MSHLEPAKYQHGHHIAPTVVARNPFVCKDLFLKWMPFVPFLVSDQESISSLDAHTEDENPATARRFLVRRTGPGLRFHGVEYSEVTDL